MVKKIKLNYLIIASIFLGGLIIGATYWLTVNVPNTGAAGGAPAHGRYGGSYYCCGYGNSCSASSCDSWDIAHIQQDLNYLHEHLSGYRIPSGWYPLTDNNVYGGDSYNSQTREAVEDLQEWYQKYLDSNAVVSGNFFNQTTTYAHLLVAQAEIDPVRHPAGVSIRYPVWSECRLITNNNSRPFVVPFKTSGEWSRFKSYAPNKSNVAADCGPTLPSGGGGGDGGSSPPPDGGTINCSSICSDGDPNCGGADSCSARGCSSCAPYGSVCLC